MSTDKRELNISITKKGGSTASKNALSYRLILPAAWMNEMGITQENRAVDVDFDGKKIIIKKL